MADYSDIYQEAGDAHGLDPDLIRAKDYVESGHDRFAVSPAGAEGVAQLMPRTAKELEVTDTFDPRQSIHGGAKYLRQQLNTFGNPYTALAAYNAGPHGDFSNPETVDYVNKVADKWDEYRQQKWNQRRKPAAGAVSFDDLPDAKQQQAVSFDDLPDAKPDKTALPPAQRDEAAPPPPQQNFARNRPYVAAGAHDFASQLPPDKEASFRKWVADNKVPFDPNDKTPDYDMRGYWAAANTPGAWADLQAKNKIPHDMQPGGTKVDPNDGRPHFPDWWKTPYHQTFSNESQWADPAAAPHWTPDDKLVTPDGKVVFDDRAQHPPEAEDAGWAETAKQAFLAPIRGAAQTAQSVTNTPQATGAKPIRAAEPMGWADLKDPVTLGKKALYGFVASAPEMAAFMGASAAAGGPETPIGLGAGALGAAIAHTAVSFGPEFRAELDQTPKDPDGAFNRAVKKTGVGSVAAGLGFAAFGAVNPFESGLKNLMFQAFGVQPAISAGEHVATNVMEGHPATEGVAASYPAAVLGTMVPAAAMHGAGMLLPKGQRPPGVSPGQTPPDPALTVSNQSHGSNITLPDLPDNYFPPPPEPPTPPAPPPPAPEPVGHVVSVTPTGTNALHQQWRLRPTPAADPVANAHRTLSIIAQGGDPAKQEQTAPPPAPAPPPVPPAPPPVESTPPPAPPPPPAPAPGPDASAQRTEPRTPIQIQKEDGLGYNAARAKAEAEGWKPRDEVAPTQTTPSPESTPPAVKSGSYVMLDPADLNVDPVRFQFKASDPEKGVTGVLRGSDRWEATLADPITAWQDKDGKVWVANGHQRTDLANRAIAAGQQDVQVPAKIYREADGFTAGYMRALGAYQNIAQGSGTAIDAAKIMREVNKAPADYQLPTLPPKSALTIQARGLSKLSDEAFGAVINEVVPAAYAAHVGDLISDPAQQMAAIRVLNRAEPGNAEQARMMVTDIRNEGFRKQQDSSQGSIFDDEDFVESIVPERAKVLDSALKLLRRNKTVYRAAVEGEDTLTAAGNQLDREGNVKARTENEQLIDHIDRSAQTRGPLSDALTAAARDVAGGKPVTAATSQFLAKARADFGRGGKGGVERSADHGGADAQGEGSADGRIDDPGQDGLLAPQVPLFSPLSRAADGLTQTKGSGEQMLAMLSKQAGVKPDEIKWTGLGDWLRGQKSVTKAQIQDYLRANSLNIEEVTLGHRDTDALDKAKAALEETTRTVNAAAAAFHQAMDAVGGHIENRGDRLYGDEVGYAVTHGAIDPTELPETNGLRAAAAAWRDAYQRDEAAYSEVMRLADEHHATPIPSARYSTYTLPGGKDYREMLITMPDAARPYTVKEIRLGDGDRAWEVRTPSGALHDTYAMPTMAAQDANRLNKEQGTQGYRSGHWDEPNVLAHVRLAEHTAPDGKRVLLVEEVQSDWHQKGRREGYRTDAPVTEVPENIRLRVKPNPTEPGLWSVVDGNDIRESNYWFTSEAEATAAAAAVNRRLLHDLNTANRVPDAPFKTTWPSLVMKRMVKFAVDHGFDRVAWAPGEVQGERYGLARQVNELHYIDQGDGTYLLAPTTHDGREVPANNGHPIAKDKLADYVGKEVAEKIVNGEGSGEGSAKTLSNLDLKVGGSGMRGFYDRQLPMETNKILKPYGAKVGQGEVVTGKPDRDSLKPDAQAVADHDAEWKKIVHLINTGAEGRTSAHTRFLHSQLDKIHAKMIDETYARAMNTQPVHQFDITPQIRKAVADQGLALFAPKGKINTRNQGDLFGSQGRPKPAADIAPPKPAGQQLDMFGRGDAAIQAQAKRDQEGRGALLAKVDQKRADQGLFADRQEGQGNLIKRAVQPERSELGVYPMTDPTTRRVMPGRDLTAQVQLRPGEPGQTSAAKFVITRGALTGHEYLTAVDNASGRVVHAGTNDMPGGVGFDLRGRGDLAPDSLTVHHNHPGGMGFSPQDMSLLYHPAMSHILAHSDGDVFAARIGDRIRGEREIDSTGKIPQSMMLLHKIAEKQARDLFNDFWPHLNGRITDAETRQVQKSFYDVISRLMHATGHIDYISTRAMHPVVERLLVDRLTAAGYNPTEIAAAIRVYSHEEANAALPRPAQGAHEDASQRADELHRSAAAVRPGGGAEGVSGAIRTAGARPGHEYNGSRGAGPSAADRPVLGRVPPEGAASGTTTPLTPPPPSGPVDRFLSKARDLFENGRTKLNEALTQHFTPLAGGTKRAMAIAVNFANALRGVNYQFKLLDDSILKQFPKPADRLSMGRAMDEQSVLEQKIADMRANNAQGQLGHTSMTAAQVAHAEATMRAQWTALGKGVDVLPADQRALVQRLAQLGDTVWQRMRGRGMVDSTAEGLPYYFARFVLQHDDQGNVIKPKGRGTGRDIHDFGGNLTSSGPLSRKYLTPEETLAAAQSALGDPNAFLLQDIRAVGAALNRNERAIAGKDFIDAIKRIGVANGTNMLFHGNVPAGSSPHDYFTIDGHPSFRQWTGSGFQPLYVSKEFEGPIKAVLTQPGSKLYQGAMAAKGASMSAIMWSPLMHLNVELGRALPIMKGRLFSTKFWSDGTRNSRDPGYMKTAIHDGLAPIGQSWRADTASIAEQADVNRKPPGPIGRAMEWKHNLDQKILWDTVFKLQVGIYDNLRTEFQNKGFDARVAGVMAAHEANRFAGALPQENLSRWANMTSNLLLFSRSFTLGNLGVMKDSFNGMPRQTRAVIEQHAGPQAAKDAATVLRRKALGAVLLDVGLAYLANTVIQEMFALGSRAPTMGLAAGAQSVLDDWKTQASAALQLTGETWNPMHLTKLLPQANNEPGKTNRAFLGTDDEGRATFMRTSVGKVGEEFLGWGFTPAQLIENKLSPWFRPLLEDLFGADTLGRKIYNPHPESFGAYLANAGRAVVHVMGSLGPVDQVKGTYELGKQLTGHGDPGADPLVQASRAILPATGLGQISSGVRGGSAMAFDYAAKDTQRFQQQEALASARKQYRSGQTDQAIQTLLDAGVPRASLRGLLRSMNQSSAQAASERWANRNLTPAQKLQRDVLTTGEPLRQ